jgi:hypothetical protein
MYILLLISIGLVIGSVSGALGIGGGVLLVPALIWLLGFDVKKATGTSLAILVPPIGLPAAARAFRAQQVDLAAAVWIACAFMVGAYLGRLFIEALPENATPSLRLIFGLGMIYVAMRFMLASSSEAANAAAGLVAAFTAWVAFLCLRGLGRRHLARPDLGAAIRRMEREGRGDPDYYI